MRATLERSCFTIKTADPIDISYITAQSIFPHTLVLNVKRELGIDGAEAFEGVDNKGL